MAAAGTRGGLFSTAGQRPGESTIAFGQVTLDLAQRTVERAGERVKVTPIEYHLLAHLAAHPHRVLTHRQLLKAVWGSDASEIQYLRVYVRGLRQKLEEDPGRPRRLVTALGVGYRLVAVDRS